MPGINDLLNQLAWQYQNRGNWIQRKFISQPDLSDLLEQISAQADLTSLMHLLPFALSWRDQHGLSVAQIIHRLLDPLSGIELFHFYHRLHYNYPNLSLWLSHNPPKITPRQVEDLEFFQETQISLLGLASFHPSGYVREAAVHELDKQESDRSLPFLVIRTNDWVKPVREAALSAVQKWLQPDGAVDLVDNLPLIHQVTKGQRTQQNPLLIAIQNLLSSPSNQKALEYGLKAPNRVTRRTCFKIALQADWMDRLKVIQWGQQDSDSLVRLMAVKKLAELDHPAEYSHLLQAFRSDSSAQVRQEAFRILFQHDLSSREAELQSALLDPNASIRYEAQQLAKREFDMDLPVFYRQAVANGGRLIGAISGLGETGSAADAERISALPHHPSPKVRVCVVRALSKLDSSGSAVFLWQALFDLSPRVSRTACKALESGNYIPNGQSIWAALQQTAHQHIRHNLFRLSAKLPKWDRAIFLIQAAAFGDEMLKPQAYVWIEDWFKRANLSYNPPTPLQHQELTQLLLKAEGSLNEKVRKEFLFCLK